MPEPLRVRAVRGDLDPHDALYAEALLELAAGDPRLRLVAGQEAADVLLALDGRARPRRRLRVVSLVHDLGHLFARPAFGRLEWLRQNWRVAAAARRSDHLLAPSTAVEMGLRRYLGLASDRVSAIPVLPALRRAPREAVADLRQRRGLPERYLVLAGRRHAVPIPAAILGIAVVPAGPDRQELAALLSGALAWLNPSAYEGCGLEALEAMACGTPPLVAAAGALPHTVGAAGLILSPEDPAEWTSAVRAITDDPELRRRLAANGLKAVAELRAAGPPKDGLWRALAGPGPSGRWQASGPG